MAQMLRDGVWQLIAMKAAPKTQAEYNHLVAIRDNMATANEVVFVLVVVWWIVNLWTDEPGAETPAQEIGPTAEHVLTEDAAVASETETAPEAGPEIA
jgi:hypothetical protein